MIRILHLVSTLDRGSGVMNVLINYNKNSVNLGVAFDYMYFNESDNSFSEEIKELGGRIIKIDKPKLGKKYTSYLNDIFKSFQGEYTILHIHEVYLAFMFGPIGKKNEINNILTHSHTTSYSDKFLSKIRNKILTLRIKKYANYHLACSIAAGEFLYGKNSLKNDNMIVFNNAIDTTKFVFNESARYKIKEEFQTDDCYIIGHVGRFNKQKNHSYLIDVFYEAYKDDNSIKLFLVGEGPLKQEIEDKVSKLKIDKNVFFLGNRNDVPHLLSFFDLLVMPSLFEGLPLVGVEAQSVGLPVLFSDKITEEVFFDNAIVSSLKNKQFWIDTIKNKPIVKNRLNGVEIIEKNNFDIRTESIKLTEFYKDLK